MSNHRQATDPGPSLVSIWMGALATLVTIALSVWIIWGVPIDERHVMGMALGMLLATLLAAQTIVRALDRETARARQERHRARQVAGTSPAGAAALPGPVEEWPWGQEPSTWMLDPSGNLAGPLSDPEGWMNAHRPKKRAAAWPEPIEQPGPWQDREPTQRLTPPPSPAALRSLNVPVFRDEADREAFLARQDTEIFSRPPDWQS
jgi:hypothetical protein